MGYRIIRVVAAACIGSAAAPAFAGGEPVNVLRVVPGSNSGGSHFGHSVAVSGGIAIVGAPNGGYSYNSGLAYFVDATTGQRLSVLSTDDTYAAGNLFGTSVGIHGGVAIIGAPGDSTEHGTGAGSAYLFTVAGGQLGSRLVPDSGGPNDGFGRSVAIHGGVAIIGARGDDEFGPDFGAAYLFDVQSRQQRLKLSPDDGIQNHGFGASVAVSGSIAIVGAPGDDDNGQNSGSAYLFDVSTGQQIRKLLPNDGAASDLFGGSVAISGGVALVGAPGDNEYGWSSGAAYLFDVVTGQQLFKLLPNEGAAAPDLFGGSVAVSGGVALVGARGYVSGAAYVFDAATGQQLLKLVPQQSSGAPLFGSSVALAADFAIVGAPEENDGFAYEAGAAYIVHLEEIPDMCEATPVVLADDGAADDRFGASVAVSGGVAIAGAPFDDDHGADSGSAYALDVATGQQLAKLLPDDGAADDRFGSSVDVSDGVIVVGSPSDDDLGDGSGSAYLFDVATRQQIAKLLPGDGAGGDGFGGAVAISGGVVVVGAPSSDDNGIDSGSAYVFHAVTGQQLFKLLPEDGAASDRFGVAVAVSGGIVVVGSHRDDDNGANSGSAYLFDVATGQQLFKLLPHDGAAQDEFGCSVGISGGIAIVGAWGDDFTFGAAAGSAYLFDVATGREVFKLLPDDRADSDEFGLSVSISNGVAIVGVRGDDDNGSGSGSAYIFDVASGQPWHKLLRNNGEGGEEFGGSVSVADGIVIIGASRGDHSGPESGSVYIVDLENPALRCVTPITLLAEDGAAQDRFGASVAASGGAAIIGAPFDDDHGQSSGSAYLFDVTTGEERFKLLPNDGAAYDNFGRSVATSEEIAIVGAPGDDSNGSGSGSAYLFDVATGQQILKLLPDDGAASDAFGSSVATSDSVAIVGATGDDDNGSGSGSAYVFDVATGEQLFKLLPEDGAAGDSFGVSVAISGGVAIVGASRDADNGTFSGSAYIFDIVTGQQLFKLLPDDGVASGWFGESVAISGGIAIVGAKGGHDYSGVATGSAYLFNVASGQQLHKLVPEGGSADDLFGASVAISDGLAVVGARGDDDIGSGSGSAWLVHVPTGRSLYKVLPDDGAASDGFGGAVAVSGGAVVVGAQSHDDNGDDAGAAYLFHFDFRADTCPADWDSDDVVNSGDFFAFIADFVAGEADFNTDTVTDSADFFAFIAAFLEGC